MGKTHVRVGVVAPAVQSHW